MKSSVLNANDLTALQEPNARKSCPLLLRVHEADLAPDINAEFRSRAARRTFLPQFAPRGRKERRDAAGGRSVAHSTGWRYKLCRQMFLTLVWLCVDTVWLQERRMCLCCCDICGGAGACVRNVLTHVGAAGHYVLVKCLYHNNVSCSECGL